MTRNGWSSKALAEGEKISITIRPSKDPQSNFGMLMWVVKAGGKKLEAGSAEIRNSKRIVWGLALSASLGLAAEPPDFSGIWTGIGTSATPAGKRNVEFPKDAPLTADGAARLEKIAKKAIPWRRAAGPSARRDL